MAKRGVLEHPKFARLKVKLKLSKYEALGILETLWQMVGRYTPQGDIGKYSNEEIEAWVEWDGEDGVLIAQLIACGWIDEHPDFRLIIHDWEEHVDHTTRTALKRAGLEPIRSSSSVRTVFAPPEPEPVPEPEDKEPKGAGAIQVTAGTLAQNPRPPMTVDVQGYMNLLGVPPDRSAEEAEKYSSDRRRKGWKIGSTPIADWREDVKVWVGRMPEFAKGSGSSPPGAPRSRESGIDQAARILAKEGIHAN